MRTMLRRRRRLGIQLIIGLLAIIVLSAPQPQAAEEQTTEERIAELERRVSELEAALREAIASGTITDGAELQRRIDLLTKELEKLKLGQAAAPKELKPAHGLGPAASKVYSVEHGVTIGGYGEVIFQDFDARRDDGERSGQNSEFDFTRTVLYFGYKFSERFVFNSEIEYEHASTGEEGEVSLEFGTLDFMLHESANIRAGLVLIPVGFINELHEPPVFHGVRRPDVENRILPATWRENGVGVFGSSGPFAYRAYVVNGFDAEGFSASSGLRGGRQDGSRAEARDLAFVARGDFQGVPGLVVGASLYTGDSGQGREDVNGDVIKGTVTLYDIHAELDFKGAQFRGLWSSVDVDDAGEISRDILGLDPLDPEDASRAVGNSLQGWYAQAAYDVLTPAGDRTSQSVTPFVRYERYDTQNRVPEGFSTTGINDVRVVTYGVTYKPIPNLALKVDFQDYDRSDRSGTDQFNAAVGYLF